MKTDRDVKQLATAADNLINLLATTPNERLVAEHESSLAMAYDVYEDAKIAVFGDAVGAALADVEHEPLLEPEIKRTQRDGSTDRSADT